MVHIIAGEKGKGKTKNLLAHARDTVEKTTGVVVYIDKNNDKMYEIHKDIRLIALSEYFVQGYEVFLGFLCGIIASNHDIQTMYLDDLTKLAGIDIARLEPLLDRLTLISTRHHVEIVVGITGNRDCLPEHYYENIIMDL